jgi:Asp-tRNA(Asn)/Glu-tRNA(Gln) amidotransferase B subunit
MVTKTLIPTFDLFPDQSSDLNRNQEIRDRITANFYKKLKKSWIKKSMLELLKYFVCEKDQVRVVRSKEEFEKNTIGSEHIKHKIKFIMKHFLSHKSIQRLLFEIVSNKSIDWWKLMKSENKSQMKQVFHRYLKHLIKKKMEHQ